MGSTHRSGLLKRSNESTRLIVTTILGVVFGFLVGISFPNVSVTKLNLTPSVLSSIDIPIIHGHTSDKTSRDSPSVGSDESRDSQVHGSDDGLKRFLFVETGYWSPGGCVLLDDSSRANFGISICDLGDSIGKIYVATNPRGAELLPPGIVVSETDFYLRRLWGDPSEDLKTRPRYLVTFTVGFAQRNNINAAIGKFSDDFTIVLFHYDGRASEWDQFEWSRRAIHISAQRQTKWWYAKRFLHPDVVAAYDYIFIWDEDLGVEHFNAEKYLELVKKYGLEISQPGLEPDKGLTWEMTKRRGDREVHKETTEKPGWCSDPLLPPCAAFVEIMAPVFSREAWRCVWHMIQNDLVHGWGLDFALRRCVEPAHEKIGVIDSQWIIHQVIPSLGSQGESERGKAPWEGVRDRCKSEWSQFQARLAAADRAYLAEVGRG